MLELNDVVIVYQKPITKEDREGKARLCKKLKNSSTQYGLEYWEVRFIEDNPGDRYSRWVSSDDKEK